VPEAFTVGEKYRVVKNFESIFVVPVISEKRNEFGVFDVYACNWTELGATFIPDGKHESTVEFSN
jgi:hypothetical protein